MLEERIKFNSDEKVLLEGLFEPGIKKHGVIITHPHPLYGGDMYNNVVEAIQSVYKKKGYSTLRFNFRGVGGSGGFYDNGIGEQKDVIAAYQFFIEEGLDRVDLCGYSFGAWINAQLAGNIAANASVMISPPAAMMEFGTALKMPHLKLAITGSRDEFAPPDIVRNLVNSLNVSAKTEVIEGADHFFVGYENRLAEILNDYI